MTCSPVCAGETLGVDRGVITNAWGSWLVEASRTSSGGSRFSLLPQLLSL